METYTVAQSQRMMMASIVSCYIDIDNNDYYNMSLPHRHPHMASPRPHAECVLHTDQVFLPSTRASAQDRPKVAAELRAMIWLLKFCAAAMAPSVLAKTANNERETMPPLRTPLLFSPPSHR